MAVAEISELFPPDCDAAVALLESCVPGMAVVAEEKLFDRGGGGAPRAIAAIRDGGLVGVAVTCGSWLRLLAVDPRARGVGVGGALLDAAVDDIRARGVDRIRLAAEPGNYLTPGIESDRTEIVTWFEKRGFARTGTNTNLIVSLIENALVSRERSDSLVARSRKCGYDVARATSSEKSAVIELAESQSESWAIEVERAMEAPTPGVHIAMANGGKLVAFAAHDGNNRGLGWFGPAVTQPDHRGHGLGETLVVACLVDVAAAGHDVAEIAWIGPREFYSQTVGIESERTFITMEKPL